MPAVEYVKINQYADDVECVPGCGNTPSLGSGFYSAGPAGLISPAQGSGWDGRTIACLDCGRLIDTAPEAQQPNPGDTWLPNLAPVTGRLATIPTELPD